MAIVKGWRWRPRSRTRPGQTAHLSWSGEYRVRDRDRVRVRVRTWEHIYGMEVKSRMHMPTLAIGILPRTLDVSKCRYYHS